MYLKDPDWFMEVLRMAWVGFYHYWFSLCHRKHYIIQFYILYCIAY